MTKPNGKQKTITDWDWPGGYVSSATIGHVTYLDWCKAEAKRITDAGTPCVVVQNKHGAVAVA